jgi:hypothetical protein
VPFAVDDIVEAAAAPQALMTTRTPAIIALRTLFISTPPDRSVRTIKEVAPEPTLVLG